MNFKQLLVFSILIQTQESVIHFAPAGLENLYDQAKDSPKPEELLTKTKRKIYDRYLKTWGTNKP